MQIKILFTGNFEIGGKDSHFEKGTVVDVPEADALKLIVGKCAAPVVEEDE